MSETSDTRAHRRYTSARGLDRLVFFTDAIAAIAITLLILPLVDLVADVTPGTRPGDFLAEHLPEIASFTLSFVVIARLWYAHHQLFEHVADYSTPLVLVDVVWAFTIVVLPLPTAMMTRFESDRVVIGLYIGTMAVSALTLTAMTVLIRLRPGLQSRENPIGPRVLGGIAATAVLFLVALLLALTVPGVAYASLLVMLASGPLGAVFAALLRHRMGRPAEPR